MADIGPRISGHCSIYTRRTWVFGFSGWESALAVSTRDWGDRLPLERLVSDAVGYCRDGYRVTASQAGATADKLDQLSKQRGFSEVFLVNGHPPAAGDRLTQSALADTLEQLADYDETVGHAGAIVRHPDGLVEGAADPRSDGAAVSEIWRSDS